MPNKIPDRLYNSGCLARSESYLSSPAGISGADDYHRLSYKTEQLDILLQRLWEPESNYGVIIPEILQRLKALPLSTLIDDLLAAQAPIDIADLAAYQIEIEVYLVAMIECMNGMTDVELFDQHADHFASLFIPNPRNAEKVKAIRSLFIDRLALVQKQALSSYNTIVANIGGENPLMKQIVQSGVHVPLVKIKQSIFVPRITRHTHAYRLSANCYASLERALWCFYHHSLGLLFDPLYQFGQLGVDGVRRLTKATTGWSLRTHPLLKFPITAVGSGTALVGIVGAMTKLGVPVPVSAGMGATGVMIASLVNLFASGDLKDERLPTKTLNKVFVVCVYASLCSAMMARPAISKLLLHFKYGDTIPPHAVLPHDQDLGAFYAGMILAAFNGFTSLRSTMGASVRYLADRQDPQSRYSELCRQGGVQMALLYFFMMITLAVAFAYSVPMTKVLTRKEFDDAIYENLAVLGVNVAANFTTAAIFINRTIDWIYEMFHPELSRGCTYWLVTIANLFMIGSFYLIANFGNGEASTAELTDNNYWQTGIGGVTALAIFPSVWQSVKMISAKIVECCGYGRSDQIEDFDNLERQPLLQGTPPQTATPSVDSGFGSPTRQK